MNKSHIIPLGFKINKLISNVWKQLLATKNQVDLNLIPRFSFVYWHLTSSIYPICQQKQIKVEFWAFYATFKLVAEETCCYDIYMDNDYTELLRNGQSNWLIDWGHSFGLCTLLANQKSCFTAAR